MPTSTSSADAAGPGSRGPFSFLFGRLDWAPPPWWHRIARAVDGYRAWAKANRPRAIATALGMLLAGALLVAAIGWWKTRPQPQYASVTLTPPAARNYRETDSIPEPLVVEFGEPAAPLERIGKDAGEGVTLSPAIEGQWTWDDETRLAFRPKGDWPVGQRYALRLDRRALLRTGLLLKEDRYELSSAPFAANVDRAEFYQDPTDPAMKKTIVAVRFSHPVDPKSFEERVRLAPKGATRGLLGLGGAERPFRVSYDEKRLAAFVHSEPLQLADAESELEVRIGEGVRSSLGGPGTSEDLATSVKVPGRFSLAISNATLSFVTNERLETEQILTIETSEGVAPQELARRLKLWLLPVHHPDTAPERREQPFDWNTPALVADEIIAVSEELKLESIEASSEHPTLHSFKYSAEVGRYLYIRVDQGLKSFGGFELGKRWDATQRVPELPKEVRILQSGALLSLRGERRLSLYSRDLPALRYEIGRVLPDRLHLLATQTSGAFTNPQFNGWSFTFDDLTQVQESVQPVEAAPAGRAQYHGFDLTPYLEREGGPRTGVFMVRIQGWDPRRRMPLEGRDERLLLVTDLGVLVKRAADGTQDVFVQSIASGEPVGGAVVQLLGRNGVAIATRTTDEQGRAQLPSTKGLQREREPALWLVRKDEDAAFLPVGREDRRLDTSRFDVGGVSNATEAGAMSAYLFSDRGIYRPGDTARIGMIVKAASWATSLAGVPLEAVVSDPRGNTVKRQRLRLSAAAFEELEYASSEASPTGVYNAGLYIVKDGQADARIGSVAFNVQEFLPDRLKLAVRFSEEREAGWVSPQNLEAQASLRTLFDTAAASRRITATLRLAPRVPQFARWKDWRFVDPANAKKSFEDELGEFTTDAQGEVRLPLRLERFEPGTYSLQLVVQGFEAGGGRGVAQVRNVFVSASDSLVGMKPDGDLSYVTKDAARKVDLVAIGRDLDPVALGDLKLALLERRWVSVLERQEDGTLRYQSRLKEIPLREQPLALPAGPASRALETGTPGDYALVVRDARGRELNRLVYSVAGSGNVARRLDRNAELELRLARTDWKPGEEIELSIRAPYAGAGLITVERERVHAFRWFRADTSASVQRIRLPEDFEGNGYVTVSFVRDANSSEIFMSPLSYGIAPFSVDLERRRVEVGVQAPERVKPGETLEVRYRSERPTRLVLFGVDEGILQVAGWRNPDPLGHFFEKRALEVDTEQILDLILPEFAQLMRAAPGGDEAGGGAKYLNPFKRRRDAPVAFWSGVVDAGPEPKIYRYAVPDSFNGSMRLVAVAVAPDAVGIATGESVVKGDFVILPNAPTHVVPGDEFELTAAVTNNASGSGAAAQIATTLGASDAFEVLGATTQTLGIAEGRESVVRFRLRARERYGSGELVLRSALGERSARVASTVSIRPATPSYATLRGGAFEGERFELGLSRTLALEQRRVEATLSATPLALAGGFEAYLADYPYGCTEQLVSQALPAIALAKRSELGRTNATAAAGRERFRRLLVELRARQNADGAFGYWPSDTDAAPLASVYALQLLIEARERGDETPRDVIERGAEWLQAFAAEEDGPLARERARAWAIYLLTRLGRVASNHANAQLERLDANYPKRWRSDITAAFLAAAYQNMRQARLANELIGGVKFSDRSRPWTIEWSEPEAWYYTERAHDAQLLYLRARHFRDGFSAVSGPAIAAIAASGRGASHNTFSAAWTVLALDAYAGAVEAAPPAQLSLAEKLRSGAVRALANGDASNAAPGPLVRRAAISAEAAAVQYGLQQGARVAYYTLTESGFDREPPKTALSEGLEITRDYLDASGKPVTTLKQGDEITVRVRFRTLGTHDYPDGVVVDLLPGGLEPVIDSLAAARSSADYVDVREDRVIAFGTIGRTTQELQYKARATTSGRFVAPGAYAESMYDPSARARAAAATLEVQPR